MTHVGYFIIIKQFPYAVASSQSVGGRWCNSVIANLGWTKPANSPPGLRWWDDQSRRLTIPACAIGAVPSPSPTFEEFCGTCRTLVPLLFPPTSLITHPLFSLLRLPSSAVVRYFQNSVQYFHNVISTPSSNDYAHGNHLCVRL